MSARDQTPREPVGISPRVDCVFKAIMGDPAHANLLMDFLNAVIAPEVPDENTLRNAPHFHHRFVVCDPLRQVVLTRHLEIHTLELEKWRANPTSPSPGISAWMSFFAEAET